MDCKKMFELQKNIVPEIVSTLNERYNILKCIESNQPIGRRLLSTKLDKTERIIRTEIDKLKNMELINSISSGMILTDLGKNLLIELDDLMFDLKNIANLESKLKNKLKINEVFIVSGNTSIDEHGSTKFGRKAADIILKKIKNNDIVGIAGGTTMALIADHMKRNDNISNITIVPARGALNEELKLQANTVACNFAHKINANYKLLHIPDDLSENELQVVKENETIHEVFDYINNVNVLIFGLGNAHDMAIRRKANNDILNTIEKEKLVAETFGYFFNSKGEMKLQMNSVGIDLIKIENVENSIAVAVGKEKADVILAFSNFHKNFSLITDESTAREILNINI
ncbi:sugar-binding transcriptional regulator [Sedimentibacter sp. zth1]|uniref:sugar-binding transcriptional regulator n=1 Tax=Sedimentibacter sp. zth1 TaxID=2816908 RepID=UPI001A90F87C|nr:sugar-binding domain-containing protein [Sedimentibacter sp. zth1]QSX06235.1 sugar-binding transcriptional regulator [Sedimentibacter sp. zth1]